MNLKNHPFSTLPFTELFRDYIENFSNLREFFDTDPHSEKEISEFVNHFSYPESREIIVENLIHFNERFDASERVLNSVKMLEQKNALAVVTGQQLTLYGGPLYTIFKIISAIVTAKRWEKKFDVPVIPVFWMADEDHDYEEISELGILGKDQIEKIKFPFDPNGEPPVGGIKLDTELEQFREEIIEHQFDTDFTHSLWKSLDQCYKKGRTVENAFGRWILTLFGKHGLILAGSADSRIKEHFSPILERAVERADDHYRELQFKSRELTEKGYHQQVHLNPSNLFRLDDDGNRVKLTRSDEEWNDEQNGLRWNKKELLGEIQDQPERFSPNVFLRPIFQSRLLPCAGYIAGPGEIAYYAQMRSYYEDFSLRMPVIVPRYSGTLIESGVERIMEKLPFEFPEYDQRIEDLESEYIDQADTPDVERIFGEWKHKISEINGEKTQKVKEIDPTLKGASEKITSFTHNELDKLKGKVYRSLKDQEETQIKRIRKIKNQLFPEQNLQEREIAFIYFMNKYGMDIWDDLMELLENEDSTTHKVIYL